MLLDTSPLVAPRHGHCSHLLPLPSLALIQQLKESSLLFSGYILRSTATASVPEPPAPSKPPRWLYPKHSTRIVPSKVTSENLIMTKIGILFLFPILLETGSPAPADLRVPCLPPASALYHGHWFPQQPQPPALTASPDVSLGPCSHLPTLVLSVNW